MRSANFVSLIACTLLTCGAPAGGQDIQFTAIPSAIPASVAYDVQGGNYDKTQWDIPCAANAIMGKVRINSAHGDPKFVSSVSIFLNPFPSHGAVIEPSSEFFALRFLTTFTNTNALSSFEKAVGGHIKQRQYFKLPVYRGRPLSFHIFWNAPGTVTATIDRGQKIELPIEKPITAVSFLVSGADVIFSDVQLGHSGPAQPECAADPAKN